MYDIPFWKSVFSRLTFIALMFYFRVYVVSLSHRYKTLLIKLSDPGTDATNCTVYISHFELHLQYRPILQYVFEFKIFHKTPLIFQVDLNINLNRFDLIVRIASVNFHRHLTPQYTLEPPQIGPIRHRTLFRLFFKHFLMSPRWVTRQMRVTVSVQRRPFLGPFTLFFLVRSWCNNNNNDGDAASQQHPSNISRVRVIFEKISTICASDLQVRSPITVLNENRTVAKGTGHSGSCVEIRFRYVIKKIVVLVQRLAFVIFYGINRVWIFARVSGVDRVCVGRAVYHLIQIKI